jgi:hypothetical protein
MTFESRALLARQPHFHVKIVCILHYESSKEHITYKWLNYIRATKERVM